MQENCGKRRRDDPADTGTLGLYMTFTFVEVPQINADTVIPMKR
jgi:hypothetical protein